MARYLRTLSAVCALAALSACGVHDQQSAPPLTGPSTNAHTLTVQVTPDVLTQDGASQSVVSVKAYGPNGAPASGVSMRAEIIVGGAVTDFGALSARNVATDTNGSATVIYTAPAPVFGAAGAVVGVRLTPIDDKDFANTNPVLATIRLVPPGIVGPPTSSLVPEFVVPAATVGNPSTFVGTISGSGADPVALLWDFGDGTTGGALTTTHTFQKVGTYLVTLSILDSLGRTNFVTHSVSVTQGNLPTASFTVSPTPPQLHQVINFNASASTAEQGHTIASYDWNFGDGTTGSGQLTTHVYNTAGTYSVSLQVTDDAGRKASTSQSVSVGTNAPTASFTSTPSSPQVGSIVNFNASQSQAASGRSIVSYDWDFGDGTRGSGVQTTHAYQVSGSFTVTLTVTDSAGQTGITTGTISVGTSAPSASFTFTPSSPIINQTVLFNGLGSSAPTGRTIASYAWNFGDGGTATGATPSHAFAAAGSYTVQLTVSDSSGQTGVTAQTITVTAGGPTAVDFTTSPQSPIVGQGINFTATATPQTGRTITSYAWNFGDGSTGTGQVTTHAYTAAGNYTVQLTVTDSAGQTLSTTKSVSVSNAQAPTAQFSFVPASPVVAGVVVTFNASASTAGTGRSIVSYVWDFGDGSAPATGLNPTHTFATGGTYSVSLTVADNGTPSLTGNASQSIQVNDGQAVINITSGTTATAPGPVTVSFDGGSSTAASGRTIVSYAWSFSNGGTATGQTVTHNYPTPLGPTTVTVTLTITDNVGHTNTKTLSFTVTGTP